MEYNYTLENKPSGLGIVQVSFLPSIRSSMTFKKDKP